MATKAQHFGLRLRLGARRILPQRPITRTIQGVEMRMPSGHALDLFTAYGATYGTNLLDLARAVADPSSEFVFLDVGANIGDSTLQVLDTVPGKAVCVEPDPTWLPYLEANTASVAGISIERSALIPAGSALKVAVARRDHGTTRLGPADAAHALPTVDTDELAAAHPVLSKLRLIKTDTDGHDVGLLPSLAKTFAASTPVIFFEYDPALTELAQPAVSCTEMWARIQELGYTAALAWSNGGLPLHFGTPEELAVASRSFDDPVRGRGFHYWDVAIAHRDDPPGQAALHKLWDARLLN